MNDSARSTVVQQKTEIFKRLFYHQNFNVVSGLFGIIGVFLAVYFYAESIKEPGLMFYVSPSRTPIVQKGNLENFSVTFRGTLITSDLSAVTIQIWNAGKQPIRSEDILMPITVSTAHAEPIYQITAQTTRDVTGLKVQSSTNGVLTLNLNILEQNDGIKLQIIYGGDVVLPLIFNGIVVGQKGIIQYTDRKKTSGIFLLIIFFIVGGFEMVLLTLPVIKIEEKLIARVRPGLFRSFLVHSNVIGVGVMMVILFISIGIIFLGYHLFNVTAPHPPFPS